MSLLVSSFSLFSFISFSECCLKHLEPQCCRMFFIKTLSSLFFRKSFPCCSLFRYLVGISFLLLHVIEYSLCRTILRLITLCLDTLMILQKGSFLCCSQSSRYSFLELLLTLSPEPCTCTCGLFTILQSATVLSKCAHDCIMPFSPLFD